MPLTQLVKISNQVPSPVKEAARRLRHNAVFNVNFGIANRKVSDKHWIYVPENNYIFYRIGFPHNFSPYQVPNGCSAVNVEISYTKEKPLKIKEAIAQARADLMRMQILKKSDKIVVEKCLHIPCAYVIYDKNHKECVQIIQDFLKENGIFSVGRYGAWEYSSMEDAIMHGKRIAEALLAVTGNPKESD
jgi:UDP-galactopyranose mutase